MKTKEKKKIICIMSIIAIIATIIILANYSERTVTNIIQLNKIIQGKAGESWVYGDVRGVLDINGTLTISGNGKMRNWSKSLDD